MSQSATIKCLPRAFRMMEAMQAKGVEWGEDYQRAAADALKAILTGRMSAAIDRRLSEMARRQEADRRNGSYSRHLLTEVGDIELTVPRTRRYSALEVVHAYARRAAHIDRMILACFVLGLSTRKVATACCRCLVGGSALARLARSPRASTPPLPPSPAGRSRMRPRAHARPGGSVAQDRRRRSAAAGAGGARTAC